MRRVLLPLAFASLAACGSAEKAAPLFGGFTPASSAAVIFAPTTCDIPFVGPTALSGLAILQGSFPDACAFITATDLCGSKASATLWVSAAVAGTVGAASAPAFGPGTYPFLANPPTGAFQAAIGTAVQTTASCGAASGSPTSMNGGQIVVASVGATRVTGSFDVRFANGSDLRQPFDVAVCPVTSDLCRFLGASASPCRAGTPPWQCVP